MLTKLEEIMAATRERVAVAKASADLRAVGEAAERHRPRGFRDNLRRVGKSGLAVIAELKKASPSKGLIRADFPVAELARELEQAGAAALSVLTDRRFFQGSLEVLRAVRAATSLPLLRKEFMLDPYQVWEARAAGADAILLIAGMIEWPAQQALAAAARQAGLDVLLEIHDAAELEPALALAPDVLGINNRNLRTPDLATDLSTTAALAPRVPADWTLISESGIRNDADVEALARVGVDAILVGERLMREPDPGAAIAARLGLPRRPEPQPASPHPGGAR